VSACWFADAGTIEQYFYGELDTAGTARLEEHLQRCAACRQHLEDLRSIRAALAVRSRVDSPPLGDWSDFTRRLDMAIATDTAPARNGALMRWVAVAATLTIVAGGVFLTGGLGHESAAPRAHALSPSSTIPTAGRLSADRSGASLADRSLMEHSEEHFERSKLVVLGVSTLDPQHARAADWQHERELARSLLPDTRLYRLAAEKRGMTDLARVLGDLETVLVETSMSGRADPEALQRVQHLIARRDLVVKMNAIGSGI
jgi:hypothetical protein